MEITLCLLIVVALLKKNGVYDKVVKILQSTQKNIIEFSGIMSNPTYAKV